MTVKYHVRLTEEERVQLKNLLKENKIARYKRERANILLGLDENGPGLSEQAVADVCGVSVRTIERVRKQCVEEGLESAINCQFSRQGRERKLDGEGEAHLIALSCSEPPEGQQRWTLKLLADRMVALDYVESISASTVGRALKKTN